MSISDTAKAWADTLQSDLQAHADLYAPDEEFSIETRMVQDHLGDTIGEREDLFQQLAYWTNQDKEDPRGIHTLTLTETFQGNGHEFLHWDYEITGLSTWYGLPVDGKTITTKGSTFLQYDEAGKIVLESTVVNQVPVYKELGLPLITPHYWEEGFDFSAFG